MYPPADLYTVCVNEPNVRRRIPMDSVESGNITLDHRSEVKSDGYFATSAKRQSAHRAWPWSQWVSVQTCKGIFTSQHGNMRNDTNPVRPLEILDGAEVLSEVHHNTQIRRPLNNSVATRTWVLQCRNRTASVSAPSALRPRQNQQDRPAEISTLHQSH